MNKRAVVLILSILLIVVLLILLSSFFFKIFNENTLVRRHLGSTEALWAAEAGVAQAIKNLPSTSSIPPTTISNSSYTGTYSTTTSHRTTINFSNYYDIISVGNVGNFSRTVHAIVKTGAVDPSKFQYGIDAANDLCFGGIGSCNRNPETFLDPPTANGCDGHACWKEFDSTINFSDMFGHQQSDVSNIATHYTDSNFPGAVSGITWVDVAQGSTLRVQSDLSGTGLLIINGNVHFAGTYQFRGIIYVLGTLSAYGTFDSYGSIVVASSAGIDTVNGTPTFHFDVTEITNALNLLASSFSSIVSWQEI